MCLVFTGFSVPRSVGAGLWSHAPMLLPCLKTWPQASRIECASSRTPRASIRRSVLSSSGALMSRSGIAPIHGNTSFCSRSSHRVPYSVLQSATLVVWKSRAVASNVCTDSARRCSLSTWRCWAGSMPAWCPSRALSRAMRAAFNVTSG